MSRNLTCPDCGSIPYALFDGYIVNDRPFEGLMFKIYPNKIELDDPNDQGYFDEFNTQMWLKRIEDHVNDPRCTDLKCSLCNEWFDR